MADKSARPGSYAALLGRQVRSRGIAESKPEAEEPGERPSEKSAVPNPETANPMHARDRRLYVILAWSAIPAALVVGCYIAWGGGQLPWQWAISGIFIGILGMAAATIYALEKKPPSPSYPGPIIVGAAAITWTLIGWQTWLWFHSPVPAPLPTVIHEPPTQEQIVTAAGEALKTVTQERDQLKQQLREALENPHESRPFTLAQPLQTGAITWQPQPQLLVIGGDQGPRIDGILFQGFSDARVQMKDAYLISNLTGHKESLKADTSKGEFPVDQVDIPSGAHIQLALEWKPPLTLQDFMDRWGDIQLTVVYDQSKYQQTYDQNYIRGLIQNTIPDALGPRVTPKGQ